MGPKFWLNLQAQYDLVRAEESVGDKIRALPTAAGAKYARPTLSFQTGKLREILNLCQVYIDYRGTYAQRRGSMFPVSRGPQGTD